MGKVTQLPESGVCIQIPICEIVCFRQGGEEGGEQLF